MTEELRQIKETQYRLLTLPKDGSTQSLITKVRAKKEVYGEHSLTNAERELLERIDL